MNPGLVVKLRPSGPWRIGSDSGARNRVDAVYHSDSLYSAVASAMLRLGSLEEWLDATVRSAESAVCFSSCFPFLDEIGFVVPPRTVWPPTSPALMSARVRWKSARFVPLSVVQAILGGRMPDEEHWTVDGASECLVPAGRHGPFRTSLRWSAAVDRLTGASERHSIACLEFRPGSGLWTIVSFRDEPACDRWQEPVKAAFRLLADSGFGGERSRGWGRSEPPEFIEGTLPEMILPRVEHGIDLPSEGEGEPEPAVEALEPPAPTEASVRAPSERLPFEAAPASPAPAEASPEAPCEAVPETAPVEPAPDPAPMEATREAPIDALPLDAAPAAAPAPAPLEASLEAPPVVLPPEAAPAEAAPAPAPMEASLEAPPEGLPEPPPEPPQAETASLEPAPGPLLDSAPVREPEPAPVEPSPHGPTAHWLLSLYTPAADDSIDWQRGNYTVLSRGGRVESPAGSGELKKQLHMVAEGSVVYAAAAPRGAALDVGPDGFAHPVFRAGFAVAIPLAEVR